MDVTLEDIDYLFALKDWPRPTELTKLHGDASARCYYRITLADHDSRILMTMPEGAASASEEITNFSGQLNEPSFVALERNMRAADIRTPTVHYYDAQRRWIILEDLGDTMLFNRLGMLPEHERVIWYERAIDLLINMQQRMATIDPAQCIAHQRSFDATLLNWEFEHFAEYALEARGYPLSTNEFVAFHYHTQHITNVIESMPQTFVHRDFQSKNLMIHNDELVVIDFQDALTGSYVYDLVALLRDSYVVLQPDSLTHLIHYFAKAQQLDSAKVTHAFYCQTLQRKMKDAGRFVYIDQVKGNPSFMQYMDDTLTYIEHAFAQLPEYAELYNVLKKYVPEWQSRHCEKPSDEAIQQ